MLETASQFKPIVRTSTFQISSLYYCIQSSQDVIERLFERETEFESKVNGCHFKQNQ